MRRTREELSAAVTGRLSTTRRRDTALFAHVDDAPSHDAVFEALTRAAELNLISARGCRVALPDTEVYLRFESPKPHDRIQKEPDPTHDLELALEYIDGHPVAYLMWPQDQTAEDFLVSLGERLQSVGQYPGDARFEPGGVFNDLCKLLETAHNSVTGGSTLPLNGVVQFFVPQWALTDYRLASVDRHGYSVPLSRLNEDWLGHMDGKSWVEHESFSKAFETALALYKAEHLAVKPPGYEEEPPF